MRNRYLDLLRAAAIVRVIVYHLYGWAWLSIVVPAMGIMFALAGSLTAASLEKRSAKKVVTSRLRRLVPPLWLLGAFSVPIMIATGWTHEHGGDHPFSIPSLLFWVFPIGDPPGSEKGIFVWETLWYIRAYVWFILLSPGMYWLYKRIGWFVILLPLIAIEILDRTGFSLPEPADSAMWDFVTFAGCWMAGFTHFDGRLRRANPPFMLFVSIVLGGAGLYYQHAHQGDPHWDLNDVDQSQALWSLAFVLFVLQFEPNMEWLGRLKPLDRLVTFLNNRAVTIYLWHNLAITAVFPVLTWLQIDDLSHGENAVELAGSFAITFVAVLLFGWAEDLAAKRRPRIWPQTSPPKPRPVEAVPAAEEPTPEPVLVTATVGNYDTALLPAITGPVDPETAGASRRAVLGPTISAPIIAGATVEYSPKVSRDLPLSWPPDPRQTAGDPDPARPAGRHSAGHYDPHDDLPFAGRQMDTQQPETPWAGAASSTNGTPEWFLHRRNLGDQS